MMMRGRRRTRALSRHPMLVWCRLLTPGHLLVMPVCLMVCAARVAASETAGPGRSACSRSHICAAEPIWAVNANRFLTITAPVTTVRSAAAMATPTATPVWRTFKASPSSTTGAAKRAAESPMDANATTVNSVSTEVLRAVNSDQKAAPVRRFAAAAERSINPSVVATTKRIRTYASSSESGFSLKQRANAQCSLLAPAMGLVVPPEHPSCARPATSATAPKAHAPSGTRAPVGPVSSVRSSATECSLRSAAVIIKSMQTLVKRTLAVPAFGIRAPAARFYAAG